MSYYTKLDTIQDFIHARVLAGDSMVTLVKEINSSYGGWNITYSQLHNWFNARGGLAGVRERLISPQSSASKPHGRMVIALCHDFIVQACAEGVSYSKIADQLSIKLERVVSIHMVLSYVQKTGITKVAAPNALPKEKKPIRYGNPYMEASVYRQSPKGYTRSRRASRFDKDRH